MKTHYYGAMTYVDAVGARLAAALCSHVRLAGDLGWVTLTEGTTDETLIRANSNGGACIHSLAGTEAIFNYFCSCKVPHLEKLSERIKNTVSGQVGIGTTLLINGYPGDFSRVTSETLYSLAKRVFALGEKDVEHRTKVVFSEDSKTQWEKFVAWGLPEIIDEAIPSAWQWKLATSSPASPRTAVLFAARAAMMVAFLQVAELQPDGPIRTLELRMEHLEAAKDIARMLYYEASGQAGYDKKIENLRPSKDNFITPHKISIAKVAIWEAIKSAPNNRVARSQIRRGIAPGVTLGLLDELV